MSLDGASPVPPAYNEEPVDEETLALLGFCNDALAPSVEIPRQPLDALEDDSAEVLADALERASLMAPVPAPQRTDGNMVQLPNGKRASIRSVVRDELGPLLGGSGYSSSSRIHRAKLQGMRPGGGGGSVARELDLCAAILPRSYVLAPILVRNARINGVMGHAVCIGVACAEDFVVPVDNKLQRPEGVPLELVPDTLFRLTFLHLASTLSACTLPSPNDVDDVEDVMPPLRGDADAAADGGAAAEGGVAAASGAGLAKEAIAQEAATGFFASPYGRTHPVYQTGRVVLANPTLCTLGSFTALSVPPEHVYAAQEHFTNILSTMDQRELLNMKPCFEADVVSPDAIER